MKFTISWKGIILLYLLFGVMYSFVTLYPFDASSFAWAGQGNEMTAMISTFLLRILIWPAELVISIIELAFGISI